MTTGVEGFLVDPLDFKSKAGLKDVLGGFDSHALPPLFICEAPRMAGKTGGLTENNFRKKVLASKVPFLVAFCTASSPCRMMETHIVSLAEEWKGKVGIGTLDADACPDVARKYSISSMPTLLLFKGEEIVARIVGLKTREALKTLLEQHVP